MTKVIKKETLFEVKIMKQRLHNQKVMALKMYRIEFKRSAERKSNNSSNSSHVQRLIVTQRKQWLLPIILSLTLRP